jgi:hypothetical protein
VLKKKRKFLAFTLWYRVLFKNTRQMEFFVI